MYMLISNYKRFDIYKKEFFSEFPYKIALFKIAP